MSVISTLEGDAAFVTDSMLLVAKCQLLTLCCDIIVRGGAWHVVCPWSMFALCLLSIAFLLTGFTKATKSVSDQTP